MRKAIDSLKLALFCLLLFLSITGACVTAAGATDPDSTSTAAGTHETEKPTPSPRSETGVPVVIENRHIATFHAVSMGRTPTDRAAAIEFRIKRAIENGTEGAVTTHAIADGIAIDLDGAAMFVITPGDVDELAGETLESTANASAKILAQAIAEAKERSDTPRMLRSIALSALTTVIFIGFLYGLVFVFRRFIIWLSTFHSKHARDFKIAGVVALNPNQLLELLRRIVIAIGWLIGLTVLQVWLSFVLSRFPYTRPWGEQLSGFLFSLALNILEGIAHALPGLVTVIVILFIARLVSGLTQSFFERIKSQQLHIGWLDAETALPTQRITVFIIWLFAFAMAYPYLPAAQTDAFKGLSVLVGLMMSIGASGVVGQLASGMILLYAKALRTGDYVKIGDTTEGTVTELGLMTTHISTGTGEEVIIPNAVIVASITRNYSREMGSGRAFALQVGVTIGYSTPWRQVHAMLLDAATSTKGILAEPLPYVIQTALSDFYIEYKLIAFAGPEAPAQRALALSELYANVLDVFNNNGVQIMSPHYFNDPSQPHVVPVDKWHSPLAERAGDFKT